MARPRNDDLEKKTLFFRRGDWDFLESIFRPNGVSTSLAVRSIISNYVDRKRAEMKSPDLDLDL